MEDLLYLVHRIPYPPNKGDKIRSYHILRHLAQRYRVFLGTFIDDPQDWQHVATLKALCAETRVLPLSPFAAKLRSLSGFVRNEPLSMPYYRDAAMQEWVDRTMTSRAIGKVLVFSSPMAQYVARFRGCRRVIDFVDVDSDKWRQYAAGKRWPMSAVYRRESRLLLEAERAIAQAFDSATFVSQPEAALFRRLAPASAGKIDHVDNGVDAAYFAPDPSMPNPYAPGMLPLVFTGAMDYWANAEAAAWFAREVFPAVRARHPRAVFTIVGARPLPEVRALGSLDGVVVTGTVPDVRPWLQHAAASVAPLRIARGIQNKVLEAMSMGKTVIASREAAEGIQAVVGKELLIAADARAFVGLIDATLAGGKASRLGEAARQRVLARYSWESGLRRLDALLDPALAPPRRSAVRALRRQPAAEGVAG